MNVIIKRNYRDGYKNMELFHVFDLSDNYPELSLDEYGFRYEADAKKFMEIAEEYGVVEARKWELTPRVLISKLNDS